MGTFSVFYDGQFWIGVAEREREGAVEVARVVFGPGEPRDFELAAWARDEFHRLNFRRVALAGDGDDGGDDAGAPARNPKRRQREAARALTTPPLSTRAQAALAAAHALAAHERKATQRRQTDEDRERQWQLRRARKKKRKRGH